jgi:hypothetical protein
MLNETRSYCAWFISMHLFGISQINQQMHNVFVLYVFNLDFYLSLDIFRHYSAILKVVKFNYINLYHALTDDS